MNELYLYVNETTNCLVVLRQLLRLEPAATINHCLSAVKRLIDQRTAAAPPPVPAAPAPAPADGKEAGVHSQFIATGDGGAAAVKRMAATHKLLQQIKSTIGLDSGAEQSAILPAIKR
jgi:hypothetical protein